MALVRFNNRPAYVPTNFNKLVDELLSDVFETKKSDVAFTPSAELAQDEKSYLVTLALPGIAKDNIEIKVDKDVLSISGERVKSETEGINYFKREFAYGKFERNFTLPEDANSESIDAKYENGLLTLTILKEEKKDTSKVIKIS